MVTTNQKLTTDAQKREDHKHTTTEKNLNKRKEKKKEINREFLKQPENK